MYPVSTSAWATQITEVLTAIPKLTITSYGADVVLAWPGSAVTFDLEAAATIDAPTWAVVPQTASWTAKGKVYLRLPATEGEQRRGPRSSQRPCGLTAVGRLYNEKMRCQGQVQLAGILWFPVLVSPPPRTRLRLSRCKAGVPPAERHRVFHESWTGSRKSGDDQPTNRH